jgi:DNA repair protein RecN (Recombination protein N)
MLIRLHIENYAIIQKLEVNFSKGLNIITGETGAGKSIIIGALGLILGERADSAVLFEKEKKCFVEGTFSTQSQGVKAFLLSNDIDDAGEVIIRREITANGKSRAFVNDTPVTLAVLKALSSQLVDLHQQFDTLELNDSDFQREVIDALAGHASLLSQYQSFYKNFIETSKALEVLKRDHENAIKENDYNNFLFTELNETGFKSNEIEDAEDELKLVSNSENIKTVLTNIYTQLNNSDQPLVQQLKSLSHQIQNIKDFTQAINPLAERLHASYVELQDIADELDTLNDSINYDAEKISFLNDRLTEGYRLFKKHGVNSTNSLLQVKDQIASKLNKVISLSDNIAAKQDEYETLKAQASQFAADLSKNRHAQVSSFEQKANKLLIKVGMPNAKIKVAITTSGALHVFGKDGIQFLFDANNTGRFEQLRKVASGGELSRLMLIIKSLVAKSIQLPTLIFDEIDSGISGEAARQVGVIMKELSGEHQIISITHQPQIAALANAHFFVYKTLKSGKVNTAIKLLTGDDRISAIAIMLSGEKPTAAAFENAKEMIGVAYLTS